jgi:hypothetical protein
MTDIVVYIKKSQENYEAIYVIIGGFGKLYDTRTQATCGFISP